MGLIHYYMRKVIVQIIPSKEVRKVYEPYFKYLKRISTLNLLKVDFLKNMELLILEIVVKDEYDFHKIKWPNSVVFYHILKEAGNTLTLFVKANSEYMTESLMSLHDLDVIWDSPSFVEKDRVIRSCIGDEINLRKFVDKMGKFGEITKIAHKKSNYKETNLTSHLTDKQKEILNIAKREGYYKLPRKINGDGLARKIGCSKATVLEHLRRIENKIMNNLVE